MASGEPKNWFDDIFGPRNFFWQTTTTTENAEPSEISVVLNDKYPIRFQLPHSNGYIIRKMDVAATENLIEDLQRAIRMVKAAEDPKMETKKAAEGPKKDVKP
jgi:hypothetical protein